MEDGRSQESQGSCQAFKDVEIIKSQTVGIISRPDNIMFHDISIFKLG